MRVLIWASALQTDILALAFHLDKSPEHELLIAGTGVETYLQEPIAQKIPLTSPLIEQTAESTKQTVLEFKADVTVTDNHFPDFKTSPAICEMWHGLGWKAFDPKHCKNNALRIQELTGKTPGEENPHYIAQCFGPHDYQYRIEHMNMLADNCKMIGVPFSELIRNPPYTRKELSSLYPFDVLNKKTLLVNFTWHYGGITNQGAANGSFLSKLFKPKNPNNKDKAFLNQICEAVISAGHNILFCMHDRKRYEASYLAIYENISQKYKGDVHVKFKDEHPDNLADLTIADAMVTNLSSFITFFYHTGRPSVHLCPVQKDDQSISFARASRKGIKYQSHSLKNSFMTDPDDNGGLTAYSGEECIEHILHALADPHCCIKRTKSWLASKVPETSETSCIRFTKALEDLVRKSQAAL